MPDFIPRADAKLILWLTNYSDKLDTYGTVVGMTAPQVTQTKGDIAGLVAAIQAVIDGEATQQGLVAARDAVKAAILAKLRAEIARNKTSTAYTAAMGEDMDIIGEASAFDPATYKPTVKVRQIGSDVEVKFGKSQTDGVNVYVRLRGQPGWLFLALDTNSPYVDNRPLAVANTPETREYKARGVVNNVEIGVDSDIVSVVYSG